MVPFTMPMTWSMGSPSNDSRSGRTSGMPPPTAASNSTSTPDASAVANTSAAVVGQQLLVGGDDRLARLERVEDELAGRLDAPDHLDDHVDVGIVHDRGGVVGEAVQGQIDPSVLGRVAHRHPG